MLTLTLFELKNYTLAEHCLSLNRNEESGIHLVEFQDFWKLLVFRIHEPLIPGKGRQRSLIMDHVEKKYEGFFD